MSHQRGEQPNPAEKHAAEQELEAFVSVGQQLVAQAAKANFCLITSRPSWTLADVEAETECAIERMEIALRDLLTIKGADPNSEQWREIWTAMENRYRETMAELLRGSGLRVRETIQ